MNFKSRFFIFIVVLCILLAVPVACAGDVSDGNDTDISTANDEILNAGEKETYTFDDLHNDIMNGNSTLEVTHDYTYSENDSPGSSSFNRSNIIINGNGFTINGIGFSQKGGSTVFGLDFYQNFNPEVPLINVTINNLTIINFNQIAMSFRNANATLNNVRFVNCSSDGWPVVRSSDFGELRMNNCYFDSKSCKTFIDSDESLVLSVNGTVFNSSCSSSAIMQNRGQLFIENCVFENFHSYQASILNFKGTCFTLRNSKFKNSAVETSGGVIIAKFFPVDLYDGSGKLIVDGEFLIENCEFSNLSAGNDGGAIFIDLDSGSQHMNQTLNIINSNFTSCSALFGGALAIQGGMINIKKSNFINNSAGFKGGAILTTWSDVNVTDSVFLNNAAFRNAGAFYFDRGKLVLNRTVFTANRIFSQSEASAGCIYANDASLHFIDSTFDNGAVSVYANFAGNSTLKNVTKNDDIFLLNNTDYVVSVETRAIRLNITKNDIVIDKIPEKFNLSDWGWVSPVKFQGDNDDCWAFATVASLESSLLKATGNYYNLSANYVQTLQLKYHPLGDLRISLTGFAYSGLGYALSWMGALPMDAVYDDRGTISDVSLDAERIHLQDAMIILPDGNNTMDMIKRAIMKYGSVTVQTILANPPGKLNVTGDEIDFMDHSIHFVTLIGWDDNFTDEVIDHGAWIVKESIEGFKYMGYDDKGILDIDYYALVPQNPAICYIFENGIDYHVNYQTDLTALTGFDANYTYYSNEFTSKYDELIGAVGTYFNESGIQYSFDVYVNGAKVHSQSGVSEFGGFRTIILDKYLPVHAGDSFKVVFKNNNLPYQAYSRVHYLPGMSMVSADGSVFKDITLENRTVCLKVYTVADDCRIVDNRDMTVTYADGSYFTVRVVTGDGRPVGAGETVTFEINGRTISAKTDAGGAAGFRIDENAGTYVITSSVNGKAFKNTVVVKAKPKPADKIVLKASKVTVKKKTAKKIVLKATLKINGKAAKGKVIKFKFRGKTYKAKTNSKGIAKKVLKKSVIKKLKKGKKYTVKVTYLKKTVKTTLRVSR